LRFVSAALLLYRDFRGASSIFGNFGNLFSPARIGSRSGAVFQRAYFSE
jgi:hypothetical protein